MLKRPWQRRASVRKKTRKTDETFAEQWRRVKARMPRKEWERMMDDYRDEEIAEMSKRVAKKGELPF